MEVETEKQRLEFYKSLRDSVAPRFAPVFIPYVPLTPEFFERRRREFLAEQPSLRDRLRPHASVLAQAIDLATFERTAMEAETILTAFTSHYVDIRQDAGVGPFLARVEDTAALVRRARTLWRGEVDQADRVDYLIAQKAQPPSTRDPYAHPLIVDGDIAQTRETQARNARGRKDAVPRATAALVSLTKE